MVFVEGYGKPGVRVAGLDFLLFTQSKCRAKSKTFSLGMKLVRTLLCDFSCFCRFVC